MMYVGDGKEYACTFEYQSSFTFQEGELEWNNLVWINKQLLCRLFVTVRL